MRRFALLTALALAAPALAEEPWIPLSGADIAHALTGRTLTYDSGARQDFRASGRTLYTAGSDSWGSWQVRGDQYCSQWPPNGDWACYDMARAGDRLRFIGAGGDVTDGTYSE